MLNTIPRTRLVGTGVLAVALFTGAAIVTENTSTPGRDDVAVVEASGTTQYCIAGGKVAIPCNQPSDPESQAVGRGLLLTILGCVAGAAGGGGPAGCIVGGLTAAAGVVGGS
jgi:hypothetical protein